MNQSPQMPQMAAGPGTTVRAICEVCGLLSERVPYPG